VVTVLANSLTMILRYFTAVCILIRICCSNRLGSV